MHDLCKELFPICRSITGNGFRESLHILRSIVPEFNTFEIPTGTSCYDWEIPQEWNIRDAYVLDPHGNKVIDFKKSNLHVMGYSIPINKVVSFTELQEHLYSLPDQPDAIPYITSYYKKRWGFCITENQKKKLKDGNYKVVVDSDLKNGSLTYAELLIPGKHKEEIFISSYLCHPSMANNELSGPTVTTYIAKWLLSLIGKRYSYRIIIVPETIGSIAYLSQNYRKMRNIIAGFNLTCIGDERAYSFLPSRRGDTLSDLAAKHTLQHIDPNYIQYSYLDRGSDERQYCSPMIDLPVCSIMRSKYGVYPEYHTSLDDLNFVTPDGLFGGYNVVQKTLECIEKNRVLKTLLPCEPQLGKRGLYPTLSRKSSGSNVRDMMNFLAYADGSMSVLQIANLIGVPFWHLNQIATKLEEAKVVMEC